MKKKNLEEFPKHAPTVANDRVKDLRVHFRSAQYYRCRYLSFPHVVQCLALYVAEFFFSSRRRHTRSTRDWSSDACSSDLEHEVTAEFATPIATLDLAALREKLR